MKFRLCIIAATLGVALAGCVAAPPPRPYVSREVVDPGPPPDTTLYSYPLQGQSPERQDRDRYECTMWAVKQTGFDPSNPNIPQRGRVRVVSGGPPPGANTAAGAVTGAVLGAAVSRPGDALGGAVVGAVIGGAVGAAADSARDQRAQAIAEEEASRERARVAQLDRKATDFKRAAGACLEGRGYSTR